MSQIFNIYPKKNKNCLALMFQMWCLSKTCLGGKTLSHCMKFSTNQKWLSEKRLASDEVEKRKSSVYKNEAIFKSKLLLAKELKENILFNDKRSGLVAINKPYGLSLLPEETENVSLTCTLPELASFLEVPEISVIKSPGKFVSGVTLLQTKQKGQNTQNRVTNCVNRSHASRIFSTKYLAITNGIPRNSGVLETVDVTLETIKTKQSIKGGTCKEPVIHRELVSETKLKQGKKYGKSKDDKTKQTKRISVVADVLARSRGNTTSLISIQPNSIKWNFLCVYMANLLSPIIGDSMFSYRVKSVLGKPIKVEHQNSPVGYDKNYLSRTILGQLGITAADEINLPLHLHHFRTHLPKFYQNRDLNIYAPLPFYFKRSMESLEISCNAEELESLDRIVNYNLPKPNHEINHQS